MIINDIYNAKIKAPVRSVKARVELLDSSALVVDTFTHDGKLMDFSIDRYVDSGKFFGMGICQHLQITIIDTNREVDYITTSHKAKIIWDDDIVSNPIFTLTQSRRDENTNELSIYGYDKIYYTAEHFSTELTLEAPYSINDVAAAIADFMGAAGVKIVGIGADTCFDTYYEAGANIEGTETIRELLDDIAEATQTVYYMDGEDYLVFRRLDKDGAADYTLSREEVINLDIGDGRRLKAICRATELGDNVTAEIAQSGTTQYVRNNVFWELREDIDTLLENAIAAVGGFSIRQFFCQWRGNPLVEMGDKIGLSAKDGSIVYTYLLDDTISYSGYLGQDSQYQFEEVVEAESNPSTLGEMLQQTYARVDKANKQVNIVVSEQNYLNERLSTLELNTESINASVSNVEQVLADRIEDTNEDIAELTTKVNATMTSTEVQVAISNAMDNGATKVETATGFTFNEKGLTVSKSESDITTTITEDGMQIAKGNSEVLTANNEGVTAIDLRAKTYLVIGENSRFEDYGSSRTGCFWIGG